MSPKWEAADVVAKTGRVGRQRIQAQQVPPFAAPGAPTAASRQPAMANALITNLSFACFVDLSQFGVPESQWAGGGALDSRTMISMGRTIS
jgi:hypothetical protein